MKPLEVLAKTKTPPPMTEEDIKLVFNHVQVILLHNTTLLETLTYRIANLDDWTVVPHVGDLLIELVAGL